MDDTAGGNGPATTSGALADADAVAATSPAAFATAAPGTARGTGPQSRGSAPVSPAADGLRLGGMHVRAAATTPVALPPELLYI